jgi:hypothetical protein
MSPTGLRRLLSASAWQSGNRSGIEKLGDRS